MRVKTLEKADTPSKKRYKGNYDRPSGRRAHHPKKGRKGSQRRGTMEVRALEKVEREPRRGAKGVKTSRRQTHHARRGTKGVKKWYDRSQDP